MNLSNFTSWDYKGTWNVIIQFACICVIMLISNTLRRKIPFLRNMLLPTAVIAGFLGLGFKYLMLTLNVNIDGVSIVRNEFYETITYHAIAIGFIALGLKTMKSEKNGDVKNEGTAIKSGLLIVSSYLIQGIVGIGITMLLSFVFKSVASYAGFLLPMGYGQGPGQAGNIGQVFQDQGFNAGKAFGLSISTLGFVWACIAGVIYLNGLVRHKKIAPRSTEQPAQVLSSEVEGKDEIPLTEAIDKLSIQICFVVLIYFVTWLFMSGVSYLLVNSGVKFLAKDINSLLWGFNFVFAILFTMLFKKFLNGLKYVKLMKRKYTNDYMLNRISGVAFDFMIVCSIMAIEVENLNNWGLIIALLIVSTLGGIVTYFYLRFACKRIYPSYEYEAMAGMFGMMTGTASTGIALLREIDPYFKTNAADDLVLGSSTAVLFGGPILLMTSFVYKGWSWLIGCYIFIIIFFAIICYFLYVFPKQRAKKKAKE